MQSEDSAVDAVRRLGSSRAFENRRHRGASRWPRDAQRVNPVEQPDSGNRFFGELVALEGRYGGNCASGCSRRALGRVTVVSPDCLGSWLIFDD